MDPSLLLALGLLAADYSQTMYIQQHPTQLREGNLFLGRHPSRLKAAAYFVGVGAGTTIVRYELPKPYGVALAYVMVGFEAGVVARNVSLNIGFSF